MEWDSLSFWNHAIWDYEHGSKTATWWSYNRGQSANRMIEKTIAVLQATEFRHCKKKWRLLPTYLCIWKNKLTHREHAAQTNPFGGSNHKRAHSDSCHITHIALCHLSATRWLCRGDFLFLNERNSPFLLCGPAWRASVGGWLPKHSMYPPEKMPKIQQVFKNNVWWVNGVSCHGSFGAATFSFSWLAVIFGPCSARCFESWHCENKCLDLFVEGVRDHLGRHLDPWGL